MSDHQSKHTTRKPHKGKRLLMFELSPDSASFGFDVSNWILTLGAFLVVVGTYGSIKTGAIKERFADERTSANELKTSEANDRAATAEMRAAEAALELAKLKAPRAMTNDQMHDLASALAEFRGLRTSVGASPATFESSWFADQLAMTLEGAGISVQRRDQTIIAQVGIAKGVVAVFTTGNEKGERFARALAKALNACGIAASAEGGLLENIMNELEKQGRPRNSPDNEWVVIAIGDKP